MYYMHLFHETKIYLFDVLCTFVPSKGEITLQILATLIHGAGAPQFFDEILKREFKHDCGVYNALMRDLMKCRDVYDALP